jgi:hypothetical protein
VTSIDTSTRRKARTGLLPDAAAAGTRNVAKTADINKNFSTVNE